MDIFDEDLLHFWKILNKHDVKYIMIGGFAVNLHGFARTTNDIDLWIKDNPENRRKLGKAFEEFGYAGVSFETLQFTHGWTNFYIGSGVQLDIMTSVTGLENISFDDCFALASVAEIEGIKIPFLNISHLIATKKACDRPKDQIDVLELEKIQLILKEKQPGKRE